MLEKDKGGRPKQFDVPMTINLQIETEMWQAVRAIASKQQISASELVRRYVAEGLEKDGKIN